ncbi:MAG: 3-phosphoshikimate 1-carboxyvinyltransferase [Janthinobacterium lividum]
MEEIVLGPYTHAAGAVRLPGSKSLSNRALLLAALATGSTLITNLLDSDDTRVMLAALERLGVSLSREGSNCQVQGVGGRFPVRDADIFVGNAGTAVRPLTAALALNDGEYRVSGVPRMHERPIGDLVDGLRQLGANIDYLGNPGFPPLAIHPAQPQSANAAAASVDDGGPALSVRGDVSSQFLTSMLMALPLLGSSRAISIDVVGELISKPYIEITIALMAQFGVQVERDAWRRFTLSMPAAYRSPGRVAIEGDASSASYFLAAGALGVGPVRVEGVGRDSIQGDVRFADVLSTLGVNVMMGSDWIEVRGLDTPDGKLAPIDLDCNLIPDAAMTLAVAALFASGPSRLRNIGSWRVKETDRIAAMACELRKLGAVVEEGPDFLAIVPPAQLRAGAVIDTYDDHRMAMCFSLASLGGVAVTIRDPACVGKTFPDYFERFQQLVRR